MSLFVNSDYSNYKYVVECSDNYIVLSNSRYADGDWQFPDTINTVTQYFSPSWLCVPGTRSFTSYQNFTQVDTTQDFWFRPDSLTIFNTGFFILIIVVFIINGLGRLFRRGGAFAR